MRALVSGSVASVLSTSVVALASRRATGFAAAGTNATSQWLWGRQAKRQMRPTVRHTAVGYGIHHASALLWAGVFEAVLLRRTPSTAARTVAAAAATSALAYGVDYGLTPKRLTPGFEAHLRPRAMFATYAAVAIGLAATALIRQRR